MLCSDVAGWELSAARLPAPLLPHAALQPAQPGEPKPGSETSGAGLLLARGPRTDKGNSGKEHGQK